MNSKNRFNWLVIMVAAAIGLFLTACGGSSSELVYRVTGTATEATVAYTDADGNTQEKTVTLPWETSFEISQEFEFELRASNNQPTGEIECEVWLDDRELGDRGSAAYVVCTGSVHPDDPGKPSSFVSYNVEVDLKDALDLMNEGELERALAKVESALDDAPNFANVYFVQGLVYKNMEEPDQALAAYGQVIALDPEFIGAYHNRGGVYLNMGEFELAVADFTAAIELDPEYVNSYYTRAIAYANMGELEAAKADVLKVQELADDPEMLAWAEEALAELDAEYLAP
jgi:tetratricopeptide (TPR) repeat protein